MQKRRHRRSGINWNNKKECWIIDKIWKSERIYIVTETDCPDEAEALLNKELDRLRKALLNGERPEYLFHEGAVRYLEERRGCSTFNTMVVAIERMMPFIGETPLSRIDTEELKPYIDWRKKEGKKTKRRDKSTGKYYFVRHPIKNASINRELEIITTILKQAASDWRCSFTKKRWIDAAPAIRPLPTTPKKGEKGEEHSAAPYPLSWTEQDKLFPLLSPRLQRMCLFKVNTGTREQEVCRLRWDWEYDVPELGITVFIIPEGYVKNGEARLVVLNSIARSVVEEQRSIWEHKSEYVFPNPKTGGDKPFSRMQTSSWNKAWERAGLPKHTHICKGVHNLKHTCGRRLRAASVPNETRKVCLGHSDGDITTHYSAAEVQELLTALEKLTERRDGIVVRPRMRTISGQADMSKMGQSRQSHVSSSNQLTG